MGWGWRGGRGRGGWVGPWPGRGPFSHLPPWQRPGWLFGRGSCWWLFGMPGWALRWGWYGYPWTPYFGMPWYYWGTQLPYYGPTYYPYYLPWMYWRPWW